MIFLVVFLLSAVLSRSCFYLPRTLPRRAVRGLGRTATIEPVPFHPLKRRGALFFRLMPIFLLLNLTTQWLKEKIQMARGAALPAGPVI